MKRKKNDLLPDKDRFVMEAIQQARYAMLLLQGVEVKGGRTAGFLDFEREINKLTRALQLLGLDVSFPVRTASNPV